MKLYEIPRESKLKIETDTGWQFLTFHHIDGMYSYITNEKGQTLHLAAWTPMKKVKDYYEINLKG